MALLTREYGIFARWPRDGIGWIHPQDVEVLAGLIPSDRIFLCESRDVGYRTLYYGARTVRIEPVLWEVVPPPDYGVDEEVEICSLVGKNDPGPAIIREVFWDRHEGCASYELEQKGLRLARRLRASDLRPIDLLRPN